MQVSNLHLQFADRKKDWFVERIYLTERGAEPRTESDKFGRRELVLHLIWGEPAEYGHRNAVAAIQIAPHLLLQILKGVEAQKIVKALLVVAMTSLYFSVVPGWPRKNRLVNHMNLIAKRIEEVHSRCFCRIAKLAAIVHLSRHNRLWGHISHPSAI